MFHSNSQEPAQVNEKKNPPSVWIRWFAIRFGMLLFDIVAVNAAYYLALVLRFYVGEVFNEYAQWCIPAFWAFSPYYTVCCVIVFACFRLYSGMWKYAGINDMNRIIAANCVTCVIHVAGTLLFVGRMPISYYGLGAAIQFAMIVVSRFFYRLFMAEKTAALRGRKETELNVMIVGVGETARIVRKKIENDHNNAAHPVCMFTTGNEDPNGRMDGIPVVSGLDKLGDYIEKYQVECVILADSIMTKDTRKQIKAVCQEADVGVQDFSGYFQGDGADLTLMKLMQYTSGPVEIVVNGTSQTYSNGEQAVMSVDGKYDVRSVSAREDKLVVELTKHLVVLNDLNEAWVHEFEQETGEEISFF